MLVDAASILVRALGFIATFQLLGMAMFLWVFGRSLSPATISKLRSIAVASGAGAMILVVMHFSLEPARMGGEFSAVMDGSLIAIALRTPQAQAVAWKIAGIALLLAWAGSSRPIGRMLGLLGAACIVLGFTRIGHTALASSRLLAASLLSVHVAIAAFWFGALVPLYRVAKDEAASVSTAVVERFSRMAVLLVPLLALAALLLALVLAGGVAGLLSTYGAILLSKAAVFAVLMGLASLNRWRYGPGLATGSASAVRAFCRCVAMEYALLALVFTATAALTTLFSPGA